MMLCMVVLPHGVYDYVAAEAAPTGLKMGVAHQLFSIISPQFFPQTAWNDKI